MIHSRLSLPHVEARACRDLWCAVLTNALRDLCGCGTAKGANTQNTRAAARAAAEAWVGDWPRRDFRLVCDLAGLDVRAVHDRLRALIKLSPEDRQQKLGPLILAVVQTNPDSTEADERTDGGIARVPNQRTEKRAGRGPHVTTRRTQVKEMFIRGISPSQMPARFAAAGLQVSMSSIWNDLGVLRRAGEIGYAHSPPPDRKELSHG